MAPIAGITRANSVAFESDSLRIRAVRCRAPAHGCGAIEYSGAHTLVLPQSGVFFKHEGRHTALVADAAHAVFFTAGLPYRVSHPSAGGDDCLVLQYTPAALRDVLAALDPAAGDAPQPFRAGAVRLDPPHVLRRRLLWHRLSRRTAGTLEAEETAFALFATAIAASRDAVPRRREPSRRGDAVRDTQAIIAAHPVERWSLASLARRVHCSPYHLARAFRQSVGLPIHQYQVRARVARSLDDVLDSQRSLSAIGLDAGFAHHSHFTATFHRTFGVTPSRLRRDATAAQAAALRKILTAPSRVMP